MTGGPTIGDHRFEGMSEQRLAELIQQVRTGPGQSAITDAAEGLKRYAAALVELDQGIHDDLARLGVAWEGRAAGMAASVTVDVAAWAGVAEAGVTGSAAGIERQGELHSGTKHALPDPSELNAPGRGDQPGGLFGYENDRAATDRAARAARDKAVDTLNNYRDGSREALDRHQALPAPPEVSVTIRPAGRGDGGHRPDGVPSEQMNGIDGKPADHGEPSEPGHHTDAPPVDACPDGSEPDPTDGNSDVGAPTPPEDDGKGGAGQLPAPQAPSPPAEQPPSPPPAPAPPSDGRHHADPPSSGGSGPAEPVRGGDGGGRHHASEPASPSPGTGRTEPAPSPDKGIPPTGDPSNAYAESDRREQSQPGAEAPATSGSGWTQDGARQVLGETSTPPTPGGDPATPVSEQRIALAGDAHSSKMPMGLALGAAGVAAAGLAASALLRGREAVPAGGPDDDFGMDCGPDCEVDHRGYHRQIESRGDDIHIGDRRAAGPRDEGP